MRNAYKRIAISGVLPGLAALAGCHNVQPLAQAGVAAGSIEIFRDISEEAGLRFHHFTGATGEYYFPETVGSGVAVLDYDGDGDLDVILIQGTVLNPKKQIADASFPPPTGWKPGVRLFRNLLKETGNLRFEDVTEKSGLRFDSYGMGVAIGDIDNDGHPDVLVTGLTRSALFHNNGGGTFTDITRAAGIDDRLWATSASLFDYDRDGRLDLCIVHYVDFTVAGNVRCSNPAGEPDYCGPKAYRGTPASLYHNLGMKNGTVRFEDVSQKSGIGSKIGPGLGVSAADFSGDGWPDLWISNDGAPNHLWINQRNGTFKEDGLVRGAAYGADGSAQANMGLAVADIDGTGAEDVYVTHLPEEGPVLYVNDGKGMFQDATIRFGLLQPSRGLTGFAAEWLDYDNDGRLDLFVADGAVKVIESQRGKERYPLLEHNQIFHNDGGRFRDVTAEAGSAFMRLGVYRGAAVADLNGDGAPDLVVTENNGPAHLLLNQAARGRHWLTVRLQGAQCNRDGIGAHITVHREGEKSVTRRVHSDGSYLSASDLCAHFGLGDSGAAWTVEVRWPDGSRDNWHNVQADRAVTLKQGTGRKP